MILQFGLKQTLRVSRIIDVVERNKFKIRNRPGNKIGRISDDRFLHSWFRFVSVVKRVGQIAPSRLGKIHSFRETNGVLGDPFLGDVPRVKNRDRLLRQLTLNLSVCGVRLMEHRSNEQQGAGYGETSVILKHPCLPA